MNWISDNWTFIGIMIIWILVAGFIIYGYQQEVNGSNDEKAEFCEDNGYQVKDKISFIFDIICYKDINHERIFYLIKTKEDGGYYLTRK